MLTESKKPKLRILQIEFVETLIICRHEELLNEVEQLHAEKIGV